MIDRSKLLSDLQKLLQRLEADLLERSESVEVPEVGKTLRAEYDRARTAERTAQNYEDWRSDYMTQAAAAWVLSCVFVRFLEDNRLIDPPLIAGPEERLARARDEHELYFRAHPKQTDREYLLAAFDQLAKLPGTKDVFGEHNPVRELPNWLSGDAAGELLKFFQKVDANSGGLVHDFTDPNWDTRFLGDLYQDLSEAARKKYALLQTPEFVEEFILDRTLDPALDEFGLVVQSPADESNSRDKRQRTNDNFFKMIDPACGSGHFLLGTFPRILDRWQRKEPGTNVRELVQRTLDSIHGVDVNPYAVAITRFRLLLAAMRACDVQRLADMPAFRINLACGDSLLHAPLMSGQQVFDFELTSGDAECEHVYHSEDLPVLKQLLRGRQYHAVVANPPYIIPRDKQLNERYRRRFGSCHGKYSMSVPFMERIFQLAVRSTNDTVGGYTGQITSNSFMKREFGKKLIESYFPLIDLKTVIDTAGAYIPGHGTPTVILFGRNQLPVQSTIRTVMGIRGEPETPSDAAKGRVWSAIYRQLDQPSSVSEFVSVADSGREAFHRHPWSMGGGGAAELIQSLSQASDKTVSDITSAIGVNVAPGEDEAYFVVAPRAPGLNWRYLRSIISGDEIRDWSVSTDGYLICPYDSNFRVRSEDEIPHVIRYLWPYRDVLCARKRFGVPMLERGAVWFEWQELYRDKLEGNWSIALAEVATHNHAVLVRSGQIFKNTAQIVKLDIGATENDYLELLGFLNSSTTCFCLKQYSHQKQMMGGDGIRIESKAKVPYAFNGSQLGRIPIPAKWNESPHRDRLRNLAMQVNSLAERLKQLTPLRAIEMNLSSLIEMTEAWQRIQDERQQVRSQMVILQEEIDFTVYSMWGLVDESVLSTKVEWKEVTLDAGDRPFDIMRGTNIDGFAVPDGIPTSWPPDLRDLWRRRMDAISQSTDLRLIEDPHYKRRWIGRQGLFNHTRNKDEFATACTAWMLQRLESYFDFDGRLNESGVQVDKLEIGLHSVSRLADLAGQDVEFLQVGELFRDDAAFDLHALIQVLVDSESVPLLPVLRFKSTGLRKRAEWEKTWSAQRNAVDPGKSARQISTPPKYEAKDFLKSDFNRLRGKLDVPKERWISFPNCEGPDGTPVIAWAGYDHLQQAQAISAYYVRVQTEFGGSDDPRLIPLLACLIELLPWLKQWHNEPHAAFDGIRMGDYFEGFVNEEARQLGKTVTEIKAWTPPARASGRAKRKKGT